MLAQLVLRAGRQTGGDPRPQQHRCRQPGLFDQYVDLDRIFRGQTNRDHHRLVRPDR